MKPRLPGAPKTLEIEFKTSADTRTQDSFHLKQVHGSRILKCDIHSTADQLLKEEGDGLWTQIKGQSLSIRVADCTAILLWGELASTPFVMGLHAGWRGTAGGIIERASQVLNGAKSVAAWLSPSICATHFEVGKEVLEAFSGEADSFAIPSRPHHYHLDLKGIQSQKLKRVFPQIELFSSPLCTYCQPDFISYRRERGKLEGSLRHSATIKY